MPFWSDMIGVPRTLAVEYPFGYILGKPGNINQRLFVILEAIRVFETANEPGVIIHSDN